MNSKKLDGKVAVISGGSCGIGLATARLFREHGATVIIAGRDQSRLDGARASLGSDVLAVRADVSQPAQVKELMQIAGDAYGSIDILFANAGISECPDILETDEAFFDQLVGINVKGVFFSFIHALPLLSENASVIFTSSVAQQKGRPSDVLYAASKAAVRSLARTLAADERVLARKIRINVVSPGAVRTPLTAAATSNPEASAWVAAQVPMGRWGEPEEIARSVLFLASDDASYMTGSEIAVDGGLGQI